MPKINQDAGEKHRDTAAETALRSESVPDAARHTSMPVVVASVNRKVNVGNFESIDVHTSLTMPVDALPQEVPLDEFKEAVSEALELGFNIASKETNQRYAAIKEHQKAQRSSQ